MKNFTKTFRRFIRRQNVMPESINALWQTYKTGGKSAVLAKLGKTSVSELLDLPPSMPKSAADKIASYQDNRSKGGMIDIVLKNGLVFGDKFSSYAHCPNVKTAISAMRGVIAA